MLAIQDVPTLLTGGSGFLAHALIERLFAEGVRPAHITCFARDEGKLLEVQQQYKVKIRTGDVANASDVGAAMVGQEQVFHLGAFKHLPLAESQSKECIRSNVLGTMNVLEASVWSQPAFVMGISTDKAFKPVNCYGMTKRLNEYLIAQYDHERTNGYTQYRCVRYGNVLGSTGSVLTIWKRAKELGEPIDVTDPDMTRYFFTVREAVDAIMTCLKTKDDGTPYIPPMRSVRIGDLAKIYEGFDGIRVVGRRPGEKDHEELSEQDNSDNAKRMQPEDLQDALANEKLL